MIRAYSNNESHVDALRTAAAVKGFKIEFRSILDQRSLIDVLAETSIFIFDLMDPAFEITKIIDIMDALESETVPPILYLLADPSDIELIAESGSIVNQDYCFAPLEVAGLAARLDVLTRLGERRRRTMETAITDRLTGLSNRKYFLRRLEEELYRTERYKYLTGAILTDIDFTTPDQELREETGTVVMKEIAEFLKGRLRKTDIIARYKWDSFAFLLPDIDPVDSMAVAKDVCRKIKLLELSVAGAKVEITAYLGHVMFPSGGIITMVDVVEALEDCCFKAKTTAGPDVIFHDTV